MFDKLEHAGEFTAGLALAAVSAAVLFWGTVSHNQSSIASIQATQAEMRQEMRDDAAYIRIRLDQLSDLLVSSRLANAAEELNTTREEEGDPDE